jgi:hypothetical protein
MTSFEDPMKFLAVRPSPPASARPVRQRHRLCDVSLPFSFLPVCLVALAGDLVLAREVLDHLGAGLHGTAPMWDHLPVLTVRPTDQEAHSRHVIQANLRAGRAVITVGEADATAVNAREPLADLTVEIVEGDAADHRTWLLSGDRETGLRATASGPHLALRTLGLLTALGQADLTGLRSRR